MTVTEGKGGNVSVESDREDWRDGSSGVVSNSSAYPPDTPLGVSL